MYMFKCIRLLLRDLSEELENMVWTDFVVRVLVISTFVVFPALADTPANCTYEDARGTWEFSTCATEKMCSYPEPHLFHMLYPNLANDEFGNQGTWTLIYNQGFEVTIAHRKWLVMFAYEKTDHCDRGLPSLSHDTLIRQWKWFLPQKVYSSRSDSTPLHVPVEKKAAVGSADTLFKNNHDLINQINSIQSSWRATPYPQFETFTLGQMKRLSGGSNSVFSRNGPKQQQWSSSPELRSVVERLPEEFSWLHPPGGQPSPVTPIRSQLSCGSCYAFAYAAGLEARIQIVSNFTRQPILSPQEIVDCCKYSQGCDGGFPYLLGKYAEDFGLVEEACLPYTGIQSPSCSVSQDCTRYYATSYAYIGGYYGASNELLMKLELLDGGPFPIGFEVYDDFEYYKSGVYRHTGLTDNVNRFDPFALTNHAVLLVGYGVDPESNLPFWLAKNSWGPDWGEKGFFRILRGVNECAVESLAVRFDPVL